MRTLIARVSRLLLPKKEAKAVVAIATCGFGCGSNGVWHVAGTSQEKAPCC